MRIERRLVSLAASLLSGVALVLTLNGPAGAQLANSPWPMLQHDSNHSGRSALLGGAGVSMTDSTFSGSTLGVLMECGTAGTPVYKADNFKAGSGPPGTNCSGIQ
jgi:hypothetical protein